MLVSEFTEISNIFHAGEKLKFPQSKKFRNSADAQLSQLLE